MLREGALDIALSSLGFASWETAPRCRGDSRANIRSRVRSRPRNSLTPLCVRSPRKDALWSCSCGHDWNTLDTGEHALPVFTSGLQHSACHESADRRIPIGCSDVAAHELSTVLAVVRTGLRLEAATSRFTPTTVGCSAARFSDCRHDWHAEGTSHHCVTTITEHWASPKLNSRRKSG